MFYLVVLSGCAAFVSGVKIGTDDLNKSLLSNEAPNSNSVYIGASNEDSNATTLVNGQWLSSHVGPPSLHGGTRVSETELVLFLT